MAGCLVGLQVRLVEACFWPDFSDEARLSLNGHGQAGSWSSAAGRVPWLADPSFDSAAGTTLLP
jgi:hypothetical protein